MRENSHGIQNRSSRLRTMTRQVVCRRKLGELLDRSSECKLVSCKFISADGICSSCANIPNLPSFRKRFLIRMKKTTDTGERDLSCVRNEYLTSEEIAEKVKQNWIV